ncbi:unnamed protein product [Diatraea saccharalis]|uniref:BRCT domain-containing protein n=1 Tax=Diatraea saccharalis TaxID=40085 RepID=A0A9N9R2I8_9NEOP|nr:unnamed protein product [Diatraea saccharalis]
MIYIIHRSQIRQATSQALKNISDSATKLVKTPITKKTRSEPTSTDYDVNRKRDGLMYTSDDDKPHAKIDHVVKRHKDDKSKQEPATSQKVKTDDRRKTTSNQKDDASDATSTFSDKQNKRTHDEMVRTKDKHGSGNKNDSLNEGIKKESKLDEGPRSSRDKHKEKTVESRDDSYSKEVKRRSETNSRNETQGRGDEDPSTSKDVDVEPRKRSRAKPERELGAVLRGVVLTFSGYVNPERAHLRHLATSMGATVTRDWEPACNLLVCAFPNTPKLKRVRSECGASVPAVTAHWLKEAHARRRRPPWRRHATEPQLRGECDSGDSGSGGDTEPSEECDTDDEIEKVLRAQKKPRVDTPPPTHARNTTPPPAHTHDDDDGGDTDRDTGRGEEELDEDSVVDFVISDEGEGPAAGARGVRGAEYRTPAWLWTCHRLRRLVTTH